MTGRKRLIRWRSSILFNARYDSVSYLLEQSSCSCWAWKTNFTLDNHDDSHRRYCKMVRITILSKVFDLLVTTSMHLDQWVHTTISNHDSSGYYSTSVWFASLTQDLNLTAVKSWPTSLHNITTINRKQWCCITS